MQIEIEELLKLPEMVVKEVKMTNTEMIIEIESRFNIAICPSCLNQCSEIRQYYTRGIKDLPITGRTVTLILTERQFYCSDCNRYFIERFNFVDTNRTMTKRYEESIYNLCKITDVKQVSIKENLLWDVVNDIFQRYAEKELKKENRYEKVRWLGIDEISMRKGHKDFACVLVDLQRPCVIDILPSREKTDIKEHLLAKGSEFLLNIEIFSTDMCGGFVSIANELMPNAKVVIDRFHVSKELNKALNNFRKSLRKTIPNEDEFIGLRWILLKHYEDLSKDEKEILQKAFVVSDELKQFYYFKESFRTLFDTELDIHKAKELLDNWIIQAEKFNNSFLNTFLKTIKRWKNLILNYFLYRISNGIVEGFNNKIKLIKRRAYGYLNFQHFHHRVLLECG